MQSKLPNVGNTIFTIMSQWAHEKNAINLSQGFPNFNPPDLLKSYVTEALSAGHNQYAPMQGLPSLRQEISKKIKTLYGADVCPEKEITVTSGATEALFAAITARVTEGDEVIIFDPAYDSYEPVIHLNGGKAIHIPLSSVDFSIDWQQVRDSVNDKTKMIIINSPHNPTGSMLSETDMKELIEIVSDSNIYILSDEVYEHIAFDGKKHLSVLQYEALAKRAFVVSSFGKTYHATGWKVGYCVAPEDLKIEFDKIHQYLTFSTCTPIQHGIARFMNEVPDFYKSLGDFYQKKRDLFCEALGPSRFIIKPSSSTYFQILDYSSICDENDLVYAKQLTIDAGVASIPVSAFCEADDDSRLLRFCFAKEDALLIEAAEKLCQI